MMIFIDLYNLPSTAPAGSAINELIDDLEKVFSSTVNSVEEIAKFLKKWGIDTVVSVVSSLYGMYSSYQQTKLLQHHTTLLENIINELVYLREHVSVAFDFAAIKGALSLASSTTSDLVGFEKILDLRIKRDKLTEGRSKLSFAYENLKLTPHHSSKLISYLEAWATCAACLIWVDNQEFLHFPRDAGPKYINTLRSAIDHLISIKPKIISFIKMSIENRFTNINFRFFTSEWIGNPSDYALFSTYFLDGEIKTFHEYRIISGLNDPSKIEKAYSGFRKEFDDAILAKQSDFIEGAAPTVRRLDANLEGFKSLLMDASFRFILNSVAQKVPAAAPNLKQNVEVYNKLGYNKFALKLASSDEGRILIEKSFAEILKHPVTDPSNEEEYQRHIKVWTVVLANDGYHQLRLGLARSPEGKAKVTHVFKNKYNRDPLPEELDKYTSKLALMGYSKLIEYINSPSSEDFDFFRASPSTNSPIVDEIPMITDKHRARL